MTQQLTKETLGAIRAEEKLLTGLSETLGVDIATVIRMTFRNSRRFLELPSLTFISETLNKPFDELVETKETETVQ